MKNRHAPVCRKFPPDHVIDRRQRVAQSIPYPVETGQQLSAALQAFVSSISALASRQPCAKAVFVGLLACSYLDFR
jgi:hypothetical protein